jgi:hypothetical protein
MAQNMHMMDHQTELNLIETVIYWVEMSEAVAITIIAILLNIIVIILCITNTIVTEV